MLRIGQPFRLARFAQKTLVLAKNSLFASVSSQASRRLEKVFGEGSVDDMDAPSR